MCLLSVQCYGGGQFYLRVFGFDILQKHDRCHCGCFKHLKRGQKRHLGTTLLPQGYARVRSQIEMTGCFYRS